MVILSFVWDFRNTTSGGLPNPFNWTLFLAGIAIALAAFINAAGKPRPNRGREGTHINANKKFAFIRVHSRPIIYRCRARPEYRESRTPRDSRWPPRSRGSAKVGRLQQFAQGRVDLAEDGSTTPTCFRHPLGVVALLRQRPGVALHDHRQLHRERFADAARARLADEKIRKVHVVGHSLVNLPHISESLVSMPRRRSRAASDCCPQMKMSCALGAVTAASRSPASRSIPGRRTAPGRWAGPDRGPAAARSAARSSVNGS